MTLLLLHLVVNWQVFTTNCRIGVVNKLDHRRVTLITPWTCRGDVRSCRKKHPILEIATKFAYSTVWDVRSATKHPWQTLARFLQSFRYKTRTNGHTHTQPFNGLWSGTTRVGRYQKKHSPTHTHPDHRTSFIIFLHLQRSMACDGPTEAHTATVDIALVNSVAR